MRTISLLLLASLTACTTPPADTADTAGDTADTGADNSDTGGDTSDTGTDTSDTGTDTSDTGTDTSDTGTDTGSAGDEYVEALIDGTQVTATSVAGYAIRNGNTISFTVLSPGGLFPGFTFVIAQTTALAVDTDYDCSLASSIVYTDASAVSYYANYNVATSCTYRLTELGDAAGERVKGTFSASMLDVTLSNGVTTTDGSFDVILDSAG